MNTSQLVINDQEFHLIRTLVSQRFGINLTDQKRSLVVGRLQKLLKDQGFTCFKDYYQAVVRDNSGAALDKLINRISTNYTYFNREQAHFDFFVHSVLPPLTSHLRSCNKQDLRIWSAGCSSGEEPYMLAMLMMEYLGEEYGDWSAGVLATDISAQALSRARLGLYDEEKIGRLAGPLRTRYFQRQQNGNWQANEQLKSQITFRRFNLMNRHFPFKRPLQVIFCRNVMIYFDAPTRDALVQRYHQCLEPGGYLFLGHSETLGREQSAFQYIMPAVYRRQ